MTGEEHLRVEFYARETLPEVATRRRDQLLGRLEWLADRERVSTVEVHTWEKKVPTDADCRERRLYERFSEWADRRGVELAPFFDTRVCYSMETGQREQRLVLPVLALAVYRGRELRSVYPYATNDGARTVVDALDAIESASPQREKEELIAD